jgi:hypothetical protein
MARTALNDQLTRPLYATVGVTDRAAEVVRGSVTDLQTRLTELREPQQLRARARQVPDKVQGFLEQHEIAYDQLVERGDALVSRIRRQESTKQTAKAARTTSSKAKATSTQASKAGRSTASSAKGAAKGAATTAQRQSKAPKSSAKAAATGAAKTTKSAAKATGDAAKKVGD